jgi:cell division protein ZapA
MAEVTITLNGRTYRLECGDGEEEHLLSLSDMVGVRLDGLKKQFGQVGDDRLLLMTALMIADELTETHQKIDDLKAEHVSADELVKSAENRAANQISAVADRIEVLSAAMGDGSLSANSD